MLMLLKRGSKKARGKLQSAMEYLMTYGWAILVIGLILGTLYFLGVFNTANLAPRAPPGACTIYRPEGPGSTANLNLEGTCGDVYPQFILQSRGVGDYVDVHGSSSPASILNVQTNNITITAWVMVIGSPYHDIVDKEDQYGMKIDYNNYPHSCTPSNALGFCLEWDTTGSWIGQSFPIPGAGFGKWMFLAVTMQGDEKFWYANGQMIGNAIVPGTISYADSNFTIGAISTGYSGYGEAEWFNGSLSNVQVYDAALTPQEIQSLYAEGIGGPPINLPETIGWWPLNGNANDYSGNDNTGYIVNQTSIDTWVPNYPTP